MELLKKYLGKEVRISYLFFGDFYYISGKLKKINPKSIKIDDKLIKSMSFRVDAVKIQDKWHEVSENE